MVGYQACVQPGRRPCLSVQPKDPDDLLTVYLEMLEGQDRASGAQHVVDCGFGLEINEPISQSPRVNRATHAHPVQPN